MKTNEELNALKEEVETVNKKLAELTAEELAQVSGGVLPVCDKPDVWAAQHWAPYTDDGNWVFGGD